MRPGDVLWWSGHVGLYVGGGEMIDALGVREGVVRRRAALPERVLRVR
jgi:cell wall-associated NlpC family hydrolase